MRIWLKLSVPLALLGIALACGGGGGGGGSQPEVLTWYLDADGDGYGDDVNTTEAVTQPEGYVARGGDCDDGNDTCYPGAPEVCDGFDNDCSGDDLADEMACRVFFRDWDGDGFGDAGIVIYAMAAPAGYVDNAGDCNDERDDIHPGAIEIVDNGIDEDCDPTNDMGDSSTQLVYPDVDGDSFGDRTASGEIGIVRKGWVLDNTDCDDTNPNVHPGAFDRVNGIDDDCDGSIDPTLSAHTFHRDADGDTYGDPNRTSRSALAFPMEGYVKDNTDCNDNDADVNPGATDVKNFKDDNCDGKVDESGGTVYVD